MFFKYFFLLFFLNSFLFANNKVLLVFDGISTSYLDSKFSKKGEYVKKFQKEENISDNKTYYYRDFFEYEFSSLKDYQNIDELYVIITGKSSIIDNGKDVSIYGNYYNGGITAKYLYFTFIKEQNYKANIRINMFFYGDHSDAVINNLIKRKQNTEYFVSASGKDLRVNLFGISQANRYGLKEYDDKMLSYSAKLKKSAKYFSKFTNFVLKVMSFLRVKHKKSLMSFLQNQEPVEKVIDFNYKIKSFFTYYFAENLNKKALEISKDYTIEYWYKKQFRKDLKRLFLKNNLYNINEITLNNLENLARFYLFNADIAKLFSLLINRNRLGDVFYNKAIDLIDKYGVHNVDILEYLHKYYEVNFKEEAKELTSILDLSLYRKKNLPNKLKKLNTEIIKIVSDYNLISKQEFYGTIDAIKNILEYNSQELSDEQLKDYYELVKYLDAKKGGRIVYHTIGSFLFDFKYTDIRLKRLALADLQNKSLIKQDLLRDFTEEEIKKNTWNYDYKQHFVYEQIRVGMLFDDGNFADLMSSYMFTVNRSTLSLQNLESILQTIQILCAK